MTYRRVSKIADEPCDRFEPAVTTDRGDEVCTRCGYLLGHHAPAAMPYTGPRWRA